MMIGVMSVLVPGTAIIAAVLVIKYWTHAVYARERENVLIVREPAKSQNEIQFFP
jgi:hypothetical protein